MCSCSSDTGSLAKLAHRTSYASHVQQSTTYLANIISHVWSVLRDESIRHSMRLRNACFALLQGTGVNLLPPVPAPGADTKPMNGLETQASI